VRLTYPENAVVVIAGIPGAGKSTLIRRVVDRSTARVVDTDDQRRDGGRASYVRHYAHIVTAVWGRRPVVIHSRGTLGTLRRTITLLSSLRGRPAHLILLDARAKRPRRASGRAARGLALGDRARPRFRGADPRPTMDCT
jgi:GTPase SAR1 family protein